MEKLRSALHYIPERLRSGEKLTVLLFAAYAIFSVVSTVYFLIIAQLRDAFMSIGFFAVVMLAFFAFEYFLRIRCSNAFIILLLSIPIGAILGSCYDFYTNIEVFDTVLHTLSGFVFALVGYSIMEFILSCKRQESCLAAVVFAISFSLAVALLWEMLEWLLTVMFNGDMQEDGIVNSIRSYFLSGTHRAPYAIEDIEQTIIMYDGGKTHVIEGGYLDLGLFDTLLDMLVCLAGDVFFAVLYAVDRVAFGGAAMGWLIPKRK